jgi:hypothetical protein
LAQWKEKAPHDQHLTPLEFQLGDNTVETRQQRFKGKHHKLHLLRYGPYKIMERVGGNAYKCKLPPQLGIHVVLNINNPKRFEQSLLE